MAHLVRPQLIQKIDEAFHKLHRRSDGTYPPDLRNPSDPSGLTPRRITSTPQDEAYRKQWMRLHDAAKQAESKCGGKVGDPVLACETAALDRVACEEKIRQEIVEGMRLANSGAIDYGEHLDPSFWDYSGPVTYKWISKAGVAPSAAVDRVFEPGADSKMECLSVMSAIYHRAIRQTIGETKFDTMYGRMPGPEISPDARVLLKFAKHKSAKEPLKPGDWVYVRGHSDYDSPEMNNALGAGEGPWRGENAVYNGNGSFSGLGLDNKTEQEMKEELLKGYNEKVDDYNRSWVGSSNPKSHGNLSDVQGIKPNAIFEPNIDAITRAAGGCP